MNIKKKDVFPDVHVARYNLAAWQKHEGDSIYLVGREVVRAGVKGEPDTGILKLFEVDENDVILQERTIWEPIYEGINLEDPRALELTNETLLIGLTAVVRDRKGKALPFPALVRIDSHMSWDHVLPPFLFIGTFGPGKNLTPIDAHTFFVRPENGYHHKLLVFSLHRQVPEKLCDIDFPTDLPWASWRIGTTMPPIWINDHEALFIIHGIQLEKFKDKARYIYSLGRAKLTRDGDNFTVHVAPEPILTPDDFIDEKGKPLVNELHPKLRRVVYSCGGIIRKKKEDILSLFVNVGDRATYEVEFAMSELKEGLF